MPGRLGRQTAPPPGLRVQALPFHVHLPVVPGVFTSPVGKQGGASFRHVVTHS